MKCHTDATDSHRLLGLNDFDESIATDCRGFSPYPLWDWIHVDEQDGMRKHFLRSIHFGNSKTRVVADAQNLTKI